MLLPIVSLFFCFIIIDAAHYKGGTVTWKPVDPYATGSTVEVIIYQQHSWTLSRFQCTQSTINNLGWYNDGSGAFSGEPFLNCYSSSSACTSSLYTLIRERTYCTDYSTTVQSSSGALIKRLTLSRTTNIIIGFASIAWASEIIATGSTSSASSWRVLTRIDLSQNYPINSSPVTGSLPIIRVVEGRTAVIQIPAADWDQTNDIRCRWASSSGTAGNECGDICSNLAGATISSSECTITWLAARRPIDITWGRTSSSYIAAIMVEDFNSTASTTAMSAVPLQMVIVTYPNPSGACNTLPAVIGDRPNRACIGVPIGTLLVERIVASVYCAGDRIVEFITVSPLFVNKTTITQVSGTTNQWYITLNWVPTTDQKGPQVFCAAPVDQRGLTGSQHCINFVVGYAAPNLVTPVIVQGSASPIGTVFSNQSIFSIQATSGVNRPNRNGTYIKIYRSTNQFTPVWFVDCGYSPDCIYTGTTLIFQVRNASWIYGAFYYILFDSGAVSGNVFCSPESTPILDPTFWVFNIWDPGLSSTTTTTTTPPTTVTVTTRPILTTTPMANLTTTGIALTTPITTTTTSITTTTTTTSTTTSSATTSTMSTTPVPIEIISPNQYESLCQQPIAIMNASLMVFMVPFRVGCLFILFTKLDRVFNPHRLMAAARQDLFSRRAQL